MAFKEKFENLIEQENVTAREIAEAWNHYCAEQEPQKRFNPRLEVNE